MANRPKLIKIEGPFLDAVERLLKTAPPPKDQKAKREGEAGLRAVKRVRKRPAGTVKRKATRKTRRAAKG